MRAPPVMCRGSGRQVSVLPDQQAAPCPVCGRPVRLQGPRAPFVADHSETPEPVRYDAVQYDVDGYLRIEIEAGLLGQRKVVPPAGEDHAYFVNEWRRRVTISISPTGRSVRVLVDGTEIPPPAKESP